jgi:hypothetical protein
MCMSLYSLKKIISIKNLYAAIMFNISYKIGDWNALSILQNLPIKIFRLQLCQKFNFY